jgi:hypothetical protein
VAYLAFHSFTAEKRIVVFIAKRVARLFFAMSVPIVRSHALNLCKYRGNNLHATKNQARAGFFARRAFLATGW